MGAGRVFGVRCGRPFQARTNACGHGGDRVVSRAPWGLVPTCGFRFTSDTHP